MKAKSKIGIFMAVGIGVFALVLLFQNCGELPQYPLDQSSTAPPVEDDNEGSGTPEPPYNPEPSPVTGYHVAGLVKNFTLNNVGVTQDFRPKVGEELVVRFQPNWEKLVQLGIMPAFQGAPADHPPAYFALLLESPNKMQALPLDFGIFEFPLELLETIVEERSIVGQLVNFSTRTVKIPQDGARYVFTFAPPRGKQVLRLIYSYSLLDFTGAVFSQMTLDQITDLVISNSQARAGAGFYYEIADFKFTLQ